MECAEEFNKIAEPIKKAGLQLGYHTIISNGRRYGGVTGYDEFLRLTDAG